MKKQTIILIVISILFSSLFFEVKREYGLKKPRTGAAKAGLISVKEKFINSKKIFGYRKKILDYINNLWSAN